MGRGEVWLPPWTVGHSLRACSLCKMLPAGLRKPRFPPSFSLEWISDYTDSVLDPEALRAEVDSFMEAYDKRIAEVGLPHRWLAAHHLCDHAEGGATHVVGWLPGGGAVATWPGHRVESRLPFFPAESWAI